MSELPSRITVKKACEVIGGDKPINPATYYRGVEKGIYPAPVRLPGTTVVRIDTASLLAALRLTEAS